MKYIVELTYEVLEGVENQTTGIKDSVRGELVSEKVVGKGEGLILPRSNSLETEYKIVEGNDYLFYKSVNLEIVEDNKAQQLEELYNDMNKEVLAGMYSTFGTTNTDSASATAMTYEAMLKRPENFISTQLPTEAAVITFASNAVKAADDYAAYRIERIAKFREDREAILGGTGE